VILKFELIYTPLLGNTYVRKDPIIRVGNIPLGLIRIGLNYRIILLWIGCNVPKLKKFMVVLLDILVKLCSNCLSFVLTNLLNIDI
jgi:hypothetical protein